MAVLNPTETKDDGQEQFAEALADAKGEPGGAPGEGAPSPPDSEPAPPPIPTGEQIITALEMGLTGCFGLLCGIQRIPWDSEIDLIAHFSEAEKESLRPYAPYIAPYVPMIAKHQDKVGVLFFLLIAGKTIKDKMYSYRNHVADVRYGPAPPPRRADVDPNVAEPPDVGLDPAADGDTKRDL